MDSETVITAMKILGPVCFTVCVIAAVVYYYLKRKYDAKDNEKLKPLLPEGQTERDYHERQMQTSFRVDLMWKRFEKLITSESDKGADDD